MTLPPSTWWQRLGCWICSPPPGVSAGASWAATRLARRDPGPADTVGQLRSQVVRKRRDLELLTAGEVVRLDSDAAPGVQELIDLEIELSYLPRDHAPPDALVDRWDAIRQRRWTISRGRR